MMMLANHIESEAKAGRALPAGLVLRTVRALRAAEQLKLRVRKLGDFYPDLDDAPRGAVPAWDSVAGAIRDFDDAAYGAE